MPTDHRAKLAAIKRFDQLIAYLRDELGWPIARDSFEEVDDLFYDFTADELGIDPKTAAKIQEIKRLRPLSPKQPWGIFFIKFEPKKLPVVVLRRILSQVALKKRASANSAERPAWDADDLLFVSNYGEGEERQISFAHFSRAQDGHDLPTLNVLGWDNRDTALHLDAVARELSEHLAWPDDDSDADAWRTRWRAAFTLRHREVVKTSKELSIRLAELARNIRDRIQTVLANETDKGPLTRLMKAFQETMIHDLDADGFADMYAQTIAYGLLSARIADPHKKTADDFAAHMRTNPFLRELMETFLKVGGRRGKAGGPGIDFDELGVSEVVELLDNPNTHMEAVVRDFGDRNPQEDPVIHFYEHFLSYYNPGEKKKRGVFYTPRPVVSYIVRSVHELLRTEFGLADGLADTTTWIEMAKRHKDLKIPEGISPEQDFVQILDPATGTGTFLVEVIDLIHKTLVAKWKEHGHGEKKIDKLWNEYVPKHLLTRLHGYELLMAPYAIAHLKIGLKLYETGYRFGSDERARVYLTNALEPAGDKQLTLDFLPALAHEAQAVNGVKRGQRFTLVIGNPPYSNYGQLNRLPYILGLLEDYKRDLDEKKINLDDDFIKFVRFAQVQVERAHIGSAAMITNNVFIDGLTHRRMRQSLMETFRRIRILDLHGNSSAKETADDGSPDENVFDITQGVAVSLLCRAPDDSRRAPSVSFADGRGLRSVKYAQLLGGRVNYNTLHPRAPHFFFTPKDLSLSAEYEAFVSLTEVFCTPSYGIQTKRDGLTIAFDDSEILQRARFLLNHSDTEVRGEFDLAEDGRDWTIKWARADLARLKNLELHTQRVLYRPFDLRSTIYTDKSKGFLAYPRWESMRCMLERNVALIAMRQVFQDAEVYSHIGVTNLLIDERTFYSNRGGTYLFPLYVSHDENHGLLTKFGGMQQHNLNPTFLSRIGTALGIRSRDSAAGVAAPTPEEVFQYSYGTLCSLTYRTRYVELLKIGYPRIPLPGSLDLFRVMAQLGGELTALHLLESPKLAKPITEFIVGRNPEVEKVSWSKNTVWIDKAQTTGFKGVRKEVWNCHIGGYQVCNKWLKDRKGRTLSKDDIIHYQKIVVALAETIRLINEIDEVIEQHGGWPGAFQIGEANAAPTRVVPFRPRKVEPKPEERYVACVPIVPLKFVAGAFSDPQHVEDQGFDWVAVESRHRLRPGMFVAQVVGESMVPAIPDGAWCLFSAPVAGTRQGKTVLVQLRDSTDPETGQRYTVKRYESKQAAKGDSWRHERITLKPVNPAFAPIVLTGEDEGELQVIAELVEVLAGEAADEGSG